MCGFSLNATACFCREPTPLPARCGATPSASASSPHKIRGDIIGSPGGVMAATTQWYMKGKGYEFCNCMFGCGCNFAGVPNSKDGSCRALVGCHILEGKAGDVDLAGVKCAAIVHWPKAIHEGNGKAAFVVDPATTDKQIEMLAQIFTGKLGGLPWELLGPTFEVVGLD